MIYTLLALMLATGGLPAEDPTETMANRIDRAARDYRIAVYDSHHDDRDRYDAHSRIGDRILAAWNGAGQPKEFAERVLNWFSEADATSVPVAAEFLAELEAIARERPPVLADPAPTVIEESADSEVTAPIVTESSGEPIQLNEPAKTKPSGARQAAEKANGFFGGLGRSLLRATISVSDDRPAARFD